MLSRALFNQRETQIACVQLQQESRNALWQCCDLAMGITECLELGEEWGLDEEREMQKLLSLVIGTPRLSPVDEIVAALEFFARRNVSK
jgi:hypothetical protein